MLQLRMGKLLKYSMFPCQTEHTDFFLFFLPHSTDQLRMGKFFCCFLTFSMLLHQTGKVTYPCTCSRLGRLCLQQNHAPAPDWKGYLPHAPAPDWEGNLPHVLAPSRLGRLLPPCSYTRLGW